MKKRFIISAIICLILLSGCKNTASEETQVRMIDAVDITSNGMLFPTYENNSRYWSYYDFNTMQYAPLCTKPNCLHTYAENCTACLSENNKNCMIEGLPFLYEKNVYYFVSGYSYNDETGRATKNIEFRRTTADGSNTKCLQTFDDYTISLRASTLLGDKYYIELSKIDREKSEPELSHYCKPQIYEIDLNDGSMKVVANFKEDWDSSLWFKGYFNNKIYIENSYKKEYMETDFRGKTDDEIVALFDEIDKATIREYYTYDTVTGETKVSELPIPLCIGEGYYVYDNNGAITVRTEDGNEFALQNYDFENKASICIAGGVLFDVKNKVCADLSENGVTRKFNIEYDRVSPDILTANNDDIVIKFTRIESQPDEDGKMTEVLVPEYRKIPKKELVGDKI